MSSPLFFSTILSQKEVETKTERETLCQFGSGHKFFATIDLLDISGEHGEKARCNFSHMLVMFHYIIFPFAYAVEFSSLIASGPNPSHPTISIPLWRIKGGVCIQGSENPEAFSLI